MEIAYLKNTSKEAIIEDIQQLFPEYNGEIEYSIVTEELRQPSVHWIGQIALFNEANEVIGMTEEHHANILLEGLSPDCLTTKKATPPINPVHGWG